MNAPAPAASAPCTVLKFGGTSVGSPERLRAVAQIIRRHQAENPRLVVVVSAMGDSTDDLIELAAKVSPNSAKASYRREMDMLLSTGERVSMALLSMALADLGIEAVSFTGSQSGIITTTRHGEARISEIRPVRIVEALDKGRIAIVAGFQGVSSDKEITTLGRGGSDTSAVALGAALRAQAVHIYTDVDGVYTADPRKVPNARRLTRMSAQHAYRAAARGAQVLHARCLEVAFKYRVPLRVVSSFAESPVGTWIDPTSENQMPNLEDPRVLSLSLQKGLGWCQWTASSPSLALETYARIQKAGLKFAAARVTGAQLELLVPQERWSDFADFVPQARLEPGAARLSILGTGLSVAEGLTQTLTQQIKDLDLKVLRFDVDDACLEIVTTQVASLEEVARKIHQLFVEPAASL